MGTPTPSAAVTGLEPAWPGGMGTATLGAALAWPRPECADVAGRVIRPADMRAAALPGLAALRRSSM